MCISDGSSDVCSADLRAIPPAGPRALRAPRRRPRRDAARRRVPTTEQHPTRRSIMTTTSQRYQATIEADPDVPIIRISRDFDATPAQLMRAHTDPELFARWVGPDGMDTKILEWDATTEIGRAHV